MPCNRNPATRRKKNAPESIYLDKALELVNSEIELIKIISQPTPSMRPACEPSSSPLRWTLSHQALLELATALHACDAVANEQGGKPSFVAFMRVLCRIFNITINDIHVKKSQMFERCTETTPFLNKMIEAFNRLS